MREPAPLSPGLRELVAAYTSALNRCPFFTKAHVGFAAALLEKERGINGEEFAEAVVRGLHAAGWDDEAIYYVITICALFNFYNRWIDASGVHRLSEEAHRAGGKRSAKGGYVR